jgi:DNA polymerase IV (DinB-like DNA polymerase)
MRIVAHLDMDAFFAAVEERDNPRFRGLPIAVGADPRGGQGRGVVATANYKARAYGLHSALPISWAWRLSEQARRRGLPPVVFVAPDFEKYVRSSREIAAIVQARVPLVERAGLDEMYMDLSFAGSYPAAEDLARDLKREIREKEKLTASIGIGPNKLIAKIASDVRKPDGLTVVREDEAEAFLEPLSIRKLPGIGPKTEATLNSLGIRTVRDLKALSGEKLEELFGKWGEDIREMARGRDDSPVEESGEVKSIGEQETFLEDTLEAELIASRLKEMAGSVFERLRESGFEAFRTIVLTVRFADFETKSRSSTAKGSLSSAEDLFAGGLRLLLPFFDSRENPKRKRVRLIGLRVEKLCGPQSELVLV